MKKLILTMLCGVLCAAGISGKNAALSSGRWVIWSGRPAPVWEDAFVTGNGRQGTMVFGRPGDERITCVHEELFIRGWDRRMQTVPNTAALMPEVRRLMKEGKSDAASALLANEGDRQLRDMGAVQRWPLIPHPAFDLCINSSGRTGEAKDYRRSLDLETGEAVTVWNDGDGGVEEAVFSSRTDDISVVRLRPVGKGPLSLSLALQETPGRKGEHFEHDLDHAFKSLQSTASSEGWLTYEARYDKDSGGYAGVARVIADGGRMTADGPQIKVEDAREVLVLVRITPFDGDDAFDTESVKTALKKLPKNYGKLFKAHAQIHAGMFNRMQMDLGCADLWKTTPVETMLEEAHRLGATPLFMEQVQAMGRYLLISSCGKFPPPLQGIWGGGWKPAWIGGFVWDSNLNLAISAASMSNLPECAESYGRYIESLLPGWRLNARNYLGCRGFIVAHYNDPLTGYLTHFGASFPWMFWAGGAGWNIRPLYEHAMMTGDRKYLEETVYPLYKEMAQFYEDYLTLGEDGLYHVDLSVSPENAPEGTNTWLSRDATMDIAIAREVFTLLIRMGEELGAGAGEMEQWKRIAEKLPAYRVNDDGALAEWIDPHYPDIYNHRHNSHFYPLFPGVELVGADGDARLQKAAGVALEKRFQFDTSSAHGLIHLALQSTRLKNSTVAAENIDRFAKRNYLYNSLVTSHEPNHYIYNLDAVLSFPRLLMEMLVFTKDGYCELLPSLPEGYPDGSLKGVRIYGGHTLDISWQGGRLKSLTIHPIADDKLEVQYLNEKRTLSLSKGKAYHW